MKTYTTKEGDMWDGVAYNCLGSSQYAGELMAVNEEYLPYYVFPAGCILNLPEIQSEKEKATSNSPWRVGSADR